MVRVALTPNSRRSSPRPTSRSLRHGCSVHANTVSEQPFSFRTVDKYSAYRYTVSTHRGQAVWSRREGVMSWLTISKPGAGDGRRRSCRPVSMRGTGWARCCRRSSPRRTRCGTRSSAAGTSAPRRCRPPRCCPPTGWTCWTVPEHFATVRTNPVTGRPDVLGVVGRGLHPDPERGARRPAGRPGRRVRRAFRDRRVVEGWPAGVPDDEAAGHHADRRDRPGRPVHRGVQLPRRDQRVPAAGLPGPGGLRRTPRPWPFAGRSRRSRSGTPPVPAATSGRPGRRWG